MDEELIDRIYECSFMPQLWPGVLGEFARIAEAVGGCLFTANAQITSWTATDSLHDGMQRVIDGGWITRGERFTRLAAARRPGFLTEYDIYTDAEMAADPVYRDLIWPAGLGWAAGNMLQLPTGDALYFAVERRRDRGPVERSVIEQLDAYYPHLARSALVGARLQLERARVASETLALLGLPALVFGPNGRVLAANELIQRLTDHVRWQAHERFSLKDATANDMLQNAITTLQLDHAQATRSFPVRDPDGEAALVGHVVPIRGSSRDIFVRCEGVLILTPIALPDAPSVELVMSLFDLTPAEARVARSLTTGKTLDGIARDQGVSRNTVRSQLQAALGKTGCSRQAELVALCSGLARVGVSGRDNPA